MTGAPLGASVSSCRAIALLATFNEERFIRPCLEHLFSQGLLVYLLDNSSTDRTVKIARAFLGRGLIGIEDLPRDGLYRWTEILRRKEELAAELDGDWFVHVDADEFRLPPAGYATLAEAFAAIDRAGFNAVDFYEFTFVPTLEEPDHDHDRFLETMRWYYPFSPRRPNQLNAWKSQDRPVDLASGAGHRVEFPGLRPYPSPFPMRHYLFLSVEHAIRKYVERRYDPSELEAGWHRARAALRAEDITLLPQVDLRLYRSDEELDASEPFTHHPVFA
jgi:glycosyltransferase involved in cell wall biosynthesis